MRVIDQAKKMLCLTDNDILCFERIHSGEYSNGYTLRTTGSGRFFIKEYPEERSLRKKNATQNNFVTSELALQRELETIERLNAVQLKGVITPKIVSYKLDPPLLIQEYVESMGFYRHLINSRNRIHSDRAIESQFYIIGQYLAEFHNLFFEGHNRDGDPVSYVHGDLNNKNIRFTKDEVFIFDPAAKILKDIVYRDISRFILLFYPFNYLLNIALPRKGLLSLKASFIGGYTQNTDFRIRPSRIRENILSILVEHTEFRKGNPPQRQYNIQNLLVSASACVLYVRIKRKKALDIVGFQEGSEAIS